MEFTKFQSLVNENPKSIFPILNSHLSDAECVVTEKIHGANFSVYLSPEGIRFASRSQVLPVETNFMNCQRVFTKDRIQELLEMYRKYQESQPDIVKGYTIRFIGEIFGGHDADGIKPVQRDIRYDGDIQFRVFAIHFSKPQNGEGVRHVPFTGVENICKTYGFETVPVLGKGKLGEMYKIDPSAQSALASKDGVIREGVCFRVENEDDMFGEPLIIKKRSPDFLENKGVASEKKVFTLRGDMAELLETLRAMVTPQRVSNVNSHHGFDNIKAFPDLHRAVMEDMVKDAMTDCGIDLTNKDLQPLKKMVGAEFVPLVRQELTK